jgi:hypothetical protein
MEPYSERTVRRVAAAQELVRRADELLATTASLEEKEMQRFDEECRRRHEQLARAERGSAAAAAVSRGDSRVRRELREQNRALVEQETRALRERVAKTQQALAAARRRAATPAAVRAHDARRRAAAAPRDGACGEAPLEVPSEKTSTILLEMREMQSKLRTTKAEMARLRERDAALQGVLASLLPPNKRGERTRGESKG